MYERYTEGSRRAVFFAAHEALCGNSAYIESRHLLIAVLRVGTPGSPELDARSEALLDQLGAAPPHASHERRNIPLNNECKRILAYTAEEADRARNYWIYPEHLLAGILREECDAQRILVKAGISLESVRAVLPQLGPLYPKEDLSKPPKFPPPPPPKRLERPSLAVPITLGVLVVVIIVLLIVLFR